MAGQSLVCFLDVLGFARMVEVDASLDSPLYAANLEGVVSAIRGRAAKAGFEVHQFSDSIVIATTYSAAIVSCLVSVVCESQYLAVERHILLRGGIALGQYTFSNGFLYSEALVAAYRLEVQKARYPRVIVDENVVTLLRGTEPAALPQIKGSVLRDRDGALFLDYLAGQDLTQHEAAVRKLMTDSDLSDVGIFEKYDWLVRYHNYVGAKQGISAMDFGLASIGEL
jgi:hypothetical protein